MFLSSRPERVSALSLVLGSSVFFFFAADPRAGIINSTNNRERMSFFTAVLLG